MLRSKKGYRRYRLLLLAVCCFAVLSGCAGAGIPTGDAGNKVLAGAGKTGRESTSPVSGFSAGNQNRAGGKTAQLPAEGTMEVQFLDVGQGDATLIQCGGEAMLIDAGNNDRADDVAAYLMSRGLTELQYVVGTHPDADHIGGLDVVIETFDCGTVLMPEVENDTKTYRDVKDAMKKKGLVNTPPVVGTQYPLGEAVFTILAPNRADYGSNINDCSVGLMLQHGEKRFLFTGDAEEEAEEDMLQNGISLKADVYKVAHHGSRSATTEEFLRQAAPSEAVISCGEGNRYGHPHAEVLNRLRMAGISVRRTDEEGAVVAVSDGKAVTWNVSPSESWQTGDQYAPDTEAAQETQPETASEAGPYILNKHTKKFHRPDCSGAEEIRPENREETGLSRDELSAQGYAPCKRCKP